MSDFQNIIAIDLGNPSGRVVLGQWNKSPGLRRGELSRSIVRHYLSQPGQTL